MAATATQGNAPPASFRAHASPNTDATGTRVVRAGSTVTRDGFRLFVFRVYVGTCWGRVLNAWGQPTETVEKLSCRQVRVISA